MLAGAAAAELEAFAGFYGALYAREFWGDHVCCAAQPEEANGSPEDLVLAGVDEGAAITGQWAEQIVEAVTDRSSVNSLLSAIGTLEERLDRAPLAQAIERRLMHGIMLGALDSEWEREHEEEVRPATFATAPGTQEGAFSSLPYADAVRLFNERKVLPRPAFDALRQGARRTAFTVARMASSEMLNVTKAELARMLNQGRHEGQGANLRDFRKFAKARLESAGWTPANKSHVETIYRTNVLTAVASGSFVEKRKPEVLAALPYWQIRGVTDSRARPTHKAAFGIVLRADHPFWKKAHPPFGYNCRCRVVARSQRWLDSTGTKVGPVPRDLPDPGFDSGTTRLISVPDAALAPPPAARPAAPAPVARPVPTVGGFPVDPGPRLPPGPGPQPPPPFAPPAPTPPATKFELLDRKQAQAFQKQFEKAGIVMLPDPDKVNELRRVQHGVFGRVLSPEETKALVGGAELLAKHGKVRVVTMVTRNEHAVVRATVTGKKHDQITVVRDFYKKNDELVAHNAFLEIHEDLKGQKIGSKLLKSQLEQFERFGVRRVHLEAAWDGQYVWPRMGYRLARPEEFPKYQAEFARHLVKNGFSEADAAAIAGRSANMNELALTTEGERKVGRDFLLERGQTDAPLIDFELTVDPADPDYQKVKAYLAQTAR
jgi:SPP1 gp7 family putative phage head morphogenesis protein